ncbi:MAG: hypothetical protein CFE26_23195 [Verrucomicrobiales bacterium VVV1]|nr:MAG: hypothetical protein CFE26_23195 [Verrucomicrobiales bacterium VVV1]
MTGKGHGPERDVRRLLSERPAIAGIAVSGMPVGSRRMEMGERCHPITGVARDGRAATLATY